MFGVSRTGAAGGGWESHKVGMILLLGSNRMREEGAKLLLRKSNVGQAWVEQNKPVSFVKALLAAEAASPVGLGYRGFF